MRELDGQGKESSLNQVTVKLTFTSIEFRAMTTV